MINRYVGIGRMTRDPEISATNNGLVARFAIAINRMVGKGKEAQADFIDCVVFGEQAKYIEQYVKKGYLVGVDGKLQSYSYQDKQGNNRSGMTVYVNQFQNYQTKESNGYQSSNATNVSGASYQPKVDDSANPYSNNGMDYTGSLDISPDDLPFSGLM